MTVEKFMQISLTDSELKGDLIIPEEAIGLIIFAHGSGSSRNSPRNVFVANFLQERGFATLLFDLLTEEEDLVYQNRFDIDLLASRLVEVTKWATTDARVKGMPIGYFGSSTGAASALRAAAQLPEVIQAVVSRGGRPDLASSILPAVHSPILLIVGSLDKYVIHLNQQAQEKLPGNGEIRIVIGASHLFSEPGKLEEVAELATHWFEIHLNG